MKKQKTRTFVVTVTYDARWPWLSKLLAYAENNQAIDHVVVADNASDPPVGGLAQHHGFQKARIIRSELNRGSAYGFKIGLQFALEHGADWVWLLDDDNLPQPGSLEALLRRADMLSAQYGADGFALLAYRPRHQADLAAGVPIKRCFPRPGSFLGFHILDIPYKIWRRLPWGRPRPPTSLPELLPVPQAAYGGLFIHRTALARIGLPMDEMVLYADDSEFSQRLARLGGRIFLMPAAQVDDLESSWQLKTQTNSSFATWLRHGPDLRAFYGARNLAYLESRQAHRPWRSINRCLYLAVLAVLALLWGRWERYRILRLAITEGESGRLGIHPRFPLP